MTFSVVTFSVVTFSVVTFSVAEFSVVTFSVVAAIPIGCGVEQSIRKACVGVIGLVDPRLPVGVVRIGGAVRIGAGGGFRVFRQGRRWLRYDSPCGTEFGAVDGQFRIRTSNDGGLSWRFSRFDRPCLRLVRSVGVLFGRLFGLGRLGAFFAPVLQVC